MQLHGSRALVGGQWSEDTPDSAWLSLDEEQDISKIVKARTIVEVLAWDPSLKNKLPMSMCSVPVQENFGGSGAMYRSCWYMLSLMGQVLKDNSDLVKGLIFDGHGSHVMIKKILHGQTGGIDLEALQQVPFFGELSHEAVASGLPRFPIAITKYQGSVIWGLCGVCHLHRVALFFFLIFYGGRFRGKIMLISFCRETCWELLFTAMARFPSRPRQQEHSRAGLLVDQNHLLGEPVDGLHHGPSVRHAAIGPREGVAHV